MLDDHVLQKLVLLGRREVLLAESTRQGRRPRQRGGAAWALGQGQRLQDAVLPVWEGEEAEKLKPTLCQRDLPIPALKGP